MVAHLTVMLTGPTEADPSLPVPTEALLGMTAQSALVVALMMWTEVLEPPARVVGLYTRAWEPTDPVIDQTAEAGLMLQLRSPPAGRLSVKVRPDAVPAPVFWIVTV